MTSPERFCTFFLDAHVYGTPVAMVQEVMQHVEMTRVPLASEVVRGLINLRGQIVPAIDLRRRLGLPALAAGQVPMNVVVRTNEGLVSLLVDEIGDVIAVHEDALEAPPATLEGFARDVVQRVYKLPGRLLLVLDIERTVDLGEGAAKPTALEDFGFSNPSSAQLQTRLR